MKTLSPVLTLGAILLFSFVASAGQIQVTETSKGRTIVFPNGKTRPVLRGVQKTYLYTGDAETLPILKDRQVRREAHDRVYLSEDGRYFAHKVLLRDFFVYTDAELIKYKAVEETTETYGPTVGRVLEQKLVVGDASGRVLWEKDLPVTEVYVVASCGKVVVHYYHPMQDRAEVRVLELKTGRQTEQWPVVFGEDVVLSKSRRFMALNGWSRGDVPGCYPFVYDLFEGRTVWTGRGCQWDHYLEFQGETLVITSQDTDRVVFKKDMMKDKLKVKR